jgi:AcrR family transcriptional regulator
MARPKSDEKRSAILAAAVQVIAVQGLSAPTAAIAKEAGVSNGALFTYFETKVDLYNQLYIELKRQMAEVAVVDTSSDATERAQLARIWSGWVRWALEHEQERRALSHLDVSNDVTEESRRIASAPYADVQTLLDRSRNSGPMRDVPLMFVAAVVMSLVDATIDYIRQDPADSDRYTDIGFEALWRAIS